MTTVDTTRTGVGGSTNCEWESDGRKSTKENFLALQTPVLLFFFYKQL